MTASFPAIQFLPYEERFYEQQQSRGCGRHALNNLFHAPYFVKHDGSKPINDVTVDTIMPPNIPLQDLCVYLNAKYPFFGRCPDDENYDINVLLAALDIVGHPCNPEVWSIGRDGTTRLTPPTRPDQLLGYVLNYGGGHWTSLRKIPDSSNRFEYINSIPVNGLPDRRFFGSVEECLRYLQDQEGRYISNMIEVSIFAGRINPNDRLSTVGLQAGEQERGLRELANAKAALQNTFATKFKGTIVEKETIEEAVTVNNIAFPATTPLVRFIATGLLAFPDSPEQVVLFRTFLESANSAALATRLSNNKGLLRNLQTAQQFLDFLQNDTGGTAVATPVATPVAVPVPLSKIVLVPLSGNTFLLDIGSNADRRRKDYSESKGSAALEEEELRLLKFLGADPAAPAIRPLLPAFFQSVFKCNSDAKAALKNGCDMSVHFLWTVRELRRLSAAQSVQTKLPGGFQLAALRAMVQQAPRMIAFMRASALFNHAKDTNNKHTAANTKTKAKGASTIDHDLEDLFTV